MRKAFNEGRIEYGSYFMMRMQERGFCILDVERVIKYGVVAGAPEHSARFNNWRYRVQGVIEGSVLNVIVAIDSKEDIDALPVINFVTAFWRGKGLRNGKGQDKAQICDRSTTTETVRPV
jgi:hypothetical protein